MACILQVSGTPGAQEIKPLGRINEYLRLAGELYGSHEMWDYFRPSPAINNNNAYDLWSLRARFGYDVAIRLPARSDTCQSWSAGPA